jgi:hypothetical protein
LKVWYFLESVLCVFQNSGLGADFAFIFSIKCVSESASKCFQGAVLEVCTNMAKRRGRKPQSIPMKIGNDPALWCFASLQEALEANTHLLARLIQAGAERAQAGECSVESSEALPVPESA